MIINKLQREEAYERLESRIGYTSLYRISNIPVPNNNIVYAKEEFKNPTSSTFDRVYPYLFRVAEEAGLIIPEITPVIEASTGNAGASFAWCARELGYYDATVITHEDTPKARVQQMKSYGAKIVFSPVGELAAGYVKVLERILAEDKRCKGKLGEDPTRMYCVTKINKKARDAPGYQRLVDEVLHDICQVDYFVCGVGSGTTISAIGRRLKQRNPKTVVIAVEPDYAPVIHRFREGVISPLAETHELLGLGASALPPEKLDIDMAIIDDVILVTNEDWRSGYDKLKTQEGKEIGRSSCAVFEAVLRLAKRVSGKVLLILFGDPSWKYTDEYLYMK